jgi:prepilin-type N-terminal cleavage/methylation domain-containing protein
MRRAGFTLVEVLVALVVLEVGLLGVAGALFLAARTMNRADAIERGVGVVELVLDSLRSRGAAGAGSARWEGGDVRWRPGSVGRVVVNLSGAGDSTLIEVSALQPRGGDEP